MAYSSKVIFNFLLFVKQLVLVAHILPLTAAANAKMLTFWYGAFVRIFVEFYGISFVKGFTLFKSFYIHNISWNHILQKNNGTIRRFCHGLAFGARINYHNILKYLFSISSSHAAKIVKPIAIYE